MELTVEQVATITFTGLEVVAFRRPSLGEWFLDNEGWLIHAVTQWDYEYPVVVRPALAARVKELKHELNNAREHMMDMYAEACPGWATDGRAICMIENAKRYREDLELKIAALESELAPIRALKVGSWQWAMVQKVIGHDVRDRSGKRRAATFLISDGEPYHLHQEPPPAPTADDLYVAIEKFRRSTGDAVVDTMNEMYELAAAYRAANAKGGA